MSFILQAFCFNRCQILAFQITCCHPAEACRSKSLWIMLEGKRAQVRRGGWRIQCDFFQFGFQYERAVVLQGCLHMEKDSFWEWCQTAMKWKTQEEALSSKKHSNGGKKKEKSISFCYRLNSYISQNALFVPLLLTLRGCGIVTVWLLHLCSVPDFNRWESCAPHFLSLGILAESVWMQQAKTIAS